MVMRNDYNGGGDLDSYCSLGGIKTIYHPKLELQDELWSTHLQSRLYHVIFTNVCIVCHLSG